MADVRISDLPAASAPDGNESVPVVQGGTTKKATVNQVLQPHTSDTTAAHAASAVSFTPTGSIAATDVQAAIAEVAAEAGGGGGSVEPVSTIGASGAAQTLTLPTGGLKTWDITLTAACALTFAGATAGQVNVITVILRQDGTGGRTVTFPSSVIWPNSAPPALSTLAGKVDVVSFFSPDGGATWFGSVVGVNFTAPSPPTVPGTPTGLSANAGNAQVSLTWTAPASGGSPITDYVVQYRTPAGSGTWQTFAEGTSATTGATVTGLTNGTQYGFRVAAVNAVGQGSYTSEVTATPTAGSSPGHGTRYLNMPGGNGNYASTPSSAALNISGTLELIVRARLADWTPAASSTLLAKWNANNADRQYILQLQTNGTLLVAWERTSGGFTSAASSVATGVADGTDKWVRARVVPDDGSGASVVTFYLSDDGSSWTQLGSTITQGGTASSIQTGTGLALNAGADSAGTSSVMTGRLYYAEVRNNNTPVSQMDFSTQTPGATSLTATTGETWSVNGSAAIV